MTFKQSGKSGTSLATPQMHLNFDDETITKLINNLKSTRPSNKSNRSKFISTVAFISGGINATRHNLKPFKEKPEIDMEPLKKVNEEFERKVAEILDIKEKKK